mgnify:CR=1 FL=1
MPLFPERLETDRLELEALTTETIEPLIRTVVDVFPVDRTTACGRSGKDLQPFV